MSGPVDGRPGLYQTIAAQQRRPQTSRAATDLPLPTPNFYKRGPSNQALDELRAPATNDVLREKATRTYHVTSRQASAPILGAPADFSPPNSPGMPSPGMTSSAHPIRPDPRPIMPRTASIDSTVSSVSNSSHKLNGAQAFRVSQDNVVQDVPSVIAAAGSAEAAIQKLLQEKQSAASHNAQLWRLVEKQRKMILDLNKNMEITLKEKERYRRKLKDQLVPSASAPSMSAATQHVDGLVGRDSSQSPAPAERADSAMLPSSLRDVSLDGRKVSDASDVLPLEAGRSETPQEIVALSSSGLPATPQSDTSISAPNHEAEKVNGKATSDLPLRKSSMRKGPLSMPLHRIPTGTPPISPQPLESPRSPTTPAINDDDVAAGSPRIATQGLSSPKNSRKAPPAPLNLSQKPPEMVVDASDSEYEDEQDPRIRTTGRGRRKTREEDDRDREILALQEEEHRSRSKKDKKSKSKSKPPVEGIPASEPTQTVPLNEITDRPSSAQKVNVETYQPTRDPTIAARNRAESDTTTSTKRTLLAPMLMSPGLPMSPRPGDRPINSPMPRPVNKAIVSIPMSPRSGMAGLPLSPRAPKQPIPLPPQTPLAFTSPHLARAEAYHQQVQQSSIADRLKASPNGSPDSERPSTSSDPRTPGEVFRGFVTEQYPDLLFPPNALPSIYIKVSSSRLRPSRQSYVAPKAGEENPVMTLAIHARSDSQQLWRIEKTLVALAQFDQQVKAVSNFRDRLPDRGLFSGHAPAKIDARRSALAAYFERMLETVMEERAAKVVCKFLSTDAIGAEGESYFTSVSDVGVIPDVPASKAMPRKQGYLTKRGKNFGGWKARYFVLDGPALKYYEDPGGQQLGTIKLQNAQIGKQSQQAQLVDEDVDNQYRHAFLILEPKRKDSSSLVRHVLCAESDEERDAWVDALLRYVDFRDDDEEAAKPAVVTNITQARSPRLQKSMNDLRPASRGKENAYHQKNLEPLRGVNYSDTTPAEAPYMVAPTTSRRVVTPSPPINGTFKGANDSSVTSHGAISAPTNLTVIQNAEQWGNKAPPTPQAHGKDKKRSIFGFRGRSSSDLAPNPSSNLNPNQSSRRDHSQTRAVFGAPLAEAVESAHPVGATTELPAVVYRCIEYLTVKNAIAEEGIFRLSGSNTVIKALRDRFNNEGDVNLAAEDKYHDVHAVASLLKLYLRELPSSILTRELHLEFLKSLEFEGHRTKIEAFNVLVHRLPKANRALLQALSAFLRDVVRNESVNKMNVRNGECQVFYIEHTLRHSAQGLLILTRISQSA